jgi:hypothetical protein
MGSLLQLGNKPQLHLLITFSAAACVAFRRYPELAFQTLSPAKSQVDRHCMTLIHNATVEDVKQNDKTTSENRRGAKRRLGTEHSTSLKACTLLDPSGGIAPFPRLRPPPWRQHQLQLGVTASLGCVANVH